MSLDDIAQLTITAATVFPSRAGFGVPLLMAYHSRTPNRVDYYTTTKQMLDDGFVVTDPAYLMASKAFSQNPRPTRVVLGKRALAYTKTVRIIPVATAIGTVYEFKVKGPNGTVTTISHTVAVATVAAIVTALQTAIDAISDVAAADNTTHVTVTVAAGLLFDLQELPPISVMKILDVTTDPGIATDLAAVAAVDNKSWYGLALDSSSEAETNAAAAWIEANYRKLFIADASDSQITDSAVTTDVASDVKGASYSRSKVVFNHTSLLHYTGLGWMAGMLPFKPGTNTWEYRTVRATQTDSLTDTQETNAKNKRASVYLELGGLPVMLNSVTGSGEWVDTIVGIDNLYQDVQLGWLALVKAASDIGQKIPYTDAGVASVVGMIRGVLNQYVKRGFLRADPAPQVTAPLVADIPLEDRAARTLPDIQFSGQLAGAIHIAQINGTLSV